MEELKNTRTFWILRAPKEVHPMADDVESLGLKKENQGIYRCYGRIADEYPIFIPKDSDYCRMFDRTLSPEMSARHDFKQNSRGLLDSNLEKKSGEAY